MEEELQNHILLSLMFLLLFISLNSFSSAVDPSTTYFILCGSDENRTVAGRAFIGDSNSHSHLALSTGLNISIKDPNPPSDSSALYWTSRIFTGPSSYKLDIESQGRHMVRLHFYPFYNQNHSLTSAVFDVSALGYTLLKNFSISNGTHVLKEYIINVDKSKLDITFNPLGKLGLAFINAIEVFSAPDELFNGSSTLVPPTGSKNYNLSTKQLETFYRINVGGHMISPADDTLWRNWEQDEKYLLHKDAGAPFDFNGTIADVRPEVAPERVYRTARVTNDLNLVSQNYNLSWSFPVTKGFWYLVRMHFCDIVSNKSSQLYFNIYIQEWLAKADFNPSPPAAALYLDFVAALDNVSNMRVSVGTASSAGALLNGLEILKINDSVGVGIGPLKKGPKISVGIGIVIGAIALVVVTSMATVVWAVFNRLRRKEAGASKKDELLFGFEEIELATSNFDENSVVGKGGFGNVYRGKLRDGTKIAVKRCISTSQQGNPEFETEIYFLSRIRHQNLVSLIGYCNEQSEMILIYEYMENGPLKKHLYGSDLPCLPWIQRLKICIGAARGLHYLHTGFTQGIIHRDLKSANILLDEEYYAKVADFGLSKLGPSADATHVTTNVKGTFGYLDPEYFRSSQLTLKSDIYSFGVVLLEVLCAQPVIDRSRETLSLVEWAMLKHASMSLGEIVDPRIAGEVSQDSLMLYWETVERCVDDYGAKRPTISSVLHSLERALRLQEAATPSKEPVISLPTIQQVQSADEQINDDNATESSCNPSERSSSQAFSQSTADSGHRSKGSGKEEC